jgi:ubiquinone/menaquinone biosynthesis C-methylase UbiE
VAQRANFQVGDAQALPFPDSSFDLVVSALVVNFIPDRPQAQSEMRPVARIRLGFRRGTFPKRPFRSGMREVVADLPALPGSEDSSLSSLRSLFAHAELEEILARTIDVMVSFPSFADFWLAQTPSYSPMTKMIAAMTKTERARLTEAVRAHLPVRRDGRIEYRARANAIKARMPR